MKKVVVAIDSFKGSLSSQKVAEAVSKAFADHLPCCEVVTFPLSDGGEGWTSVLSDALGGRYHRVPVVDPLGREMIARFGGVGEWAVIEMAAAAGLTLLSEIERNPLVTTSYGAGMLMRSALDLGYSKIMLGIGGSATNDAGLGALQALGLKCYDAQGHLMREAMTGGRMADVENIDTSLLKHRLCGVEIRVACDVNNPFFGPNGAAFVFAGQKGASAADIDLLDAGLRHVAHVYGKFSDVDIESIAGAGAAGGFGGSLSVLCGADLQSGIDCALDMLDFDTKAYGADLLITGEGSVDAQSLMGKVFSGIMKRASRNNIPVLVVGGRIEERERLSAMGVADCIEVSPRSLALAEAMRPDVAYNNIYKSVGRWLNSELGNL